MFAAASRRLGLSVDWSLAYSTIDERSRRTAQRAFLPDLDRGDAYRADGPTLWDADFGTAVAQAELDDHEVDGPGIHSRSDSSCGHHPTRACCRPAWRWWSHPADQRYAELVGSSLRTPVFGVEVPVLTHRLVEPDKGSGLVIVCTFSNLADVDLVGLGLPTRPVLGQDGRFLPAPPAMNPRRTHHWPG